ncbi:DNA-binding protein [Streptomyces sp. NPDC048560]|uniref:DNA-binding protein n=1 Tax=Streptomyces sp. NPDC048560 TaxID=3155488 RepID=UPI00343FF713
MDRTAPEDGFPHAAGNPARGALRAAGYTRLDQLTGATGAELLRLHGFGPKALRVIEEALAEKGLSLAGK